MKTLKNHTLVYDSECPMCDLYTKAFVQTGMLDKNGRVAYGCAMVPAGFNNQRAKDEIALVDYNNGTVTYGVDSLLKVLGYNLPWVAQLFQNRYLRNAASILYSFISYNRKVIAPPQVFEKRGSCTPSYQLSYRIAYLVLAWFVTSLVLSSYSSLLTPIVSPGGLLREAFICGGQIFFQMIVVRFMTKDRVMHYLGNMMTVSLIGALLLLVPLVIANWLPIAGIPALLWFGLVVSYMLYLHARRVKMLELSWTLSLTWVLYRVYILWLIL